MGAGFSLSTCKVKLGVAVRRMQGQMNKKNNFVKVQRKQIAALLNEKKDESARIRVESLFNEINLITSMEVLSLMCELLLARISLLSTAKTCPPDLVEACASIIFCSNRLDVAELGDMAKQFAAKFGEEWARSHVNNQSGDVNPRIVSKLAVKKPELKAVMEYLKGIAKQYNVKWKPNVDEESDDINRIGAIADSGHPSYVQPMNKLARGTLNITIHEARALPSKQLIGKQDPYIKIKSRSNPKINFKTRVDTNSDTSAIFHEEHFPFTVQDPDEILIIEAWNKNVISDDLLGHTSMPMGVLIANSKGTWHRLYKDKRMEKGAGQVLISTQWMPFVADGDEQKSVQPDGTYSIIGGDMYEAQPYQPQPQSQPQPQGFPSQPQPQFQPQPQPQFQPQPQPHHFPQPPQPQHQQQPYPVQPIPPYQEQQAPPAYDTFVPMASPGGEGDGSPGMPPQHQPAPMQYHQPGPVPNHPPHAGPPAALDHSHFPMPNVDNEDNQNSGDESPGAPQYDDLEARFRALQSGR